MRHNLAKEKLAAGKPVSVVAPGYSSAGLVEMLGRMGFDAIFIDCEHGPVGWEDVEHMVRAAELVDVTPIVRVQSNDHSTITRALDRGAGGVQVPHINTRAQAEAAVRAAKFAPIGHRGYAGGRASFGVKGNFTVHANAETMVVAMLEEVEALKNLDEIVKVEHIDTFFRMGSVACGQPGAPPACWQPAARSPGASSNWGRSSSTCPWAASSSQAPAISWRSSSERSLMPRRDAGSARPPKR
jgi:2-keto-3-deoxy-L-rhamnonate aldolase RhmA